MFIVEHPVTALIIALLVLLSLKIIFGLSNLIEKHKSKSKSDKKEEVKKEDNKSSDESKTKTEGKSSESKGTYGNENYLYDRFVISPTNDDSNRNCDKICNAFLNEKEANDIRDKKLDIHVEPLDIEKQKTKKVYEILQKYDDDKEKLLDDFSNMPREMKLLILENIMKNM